MDKKNLTEGLLIKGYNGFYYVYAKGVLWTCSLRGRFRIKKQDFLPGDRVEFTKLDKEKGVIENVLDRANRLVRPAVANVETALITFAFTNPEPDFLLLDRILIQVMAQKIHPVICFNKNDLVDDETADLIMKPYKDAGFTVLSVSAKDENSIDDLKRELAGKISILAGPSGVGKSSLINALGLGYDLETGRLSKKTDRGRHTTRRVELLSIAEDTYIADTPGFSSLNLPDEIKKEDLPKFYPEFQEAASYCPFKGCLHLKERECEVRNDVEDGTLDKGRYERYCIFLEELKEREKKY
ncbi:MAG: ribosome small subunit-dependent GTPase A [Firmicutes bacterium]|nr:ribosome small subunit-dependent GTPase A [Bacillota bacterium]